jgi:two-component system nitrate/nitrite response regulator NarL
MRANVIQTKILVADSRAALRRGILNTLSKQPGFGVFAESGDTNDVITKARALKPDIILLGSPSGAHEAETCQQVLAEFPETKVVIMATSGMAPNRLASLAPRVWQYPVRDLSPDQLVKSIKALSRLEDAVGNGSRELSQREREILGLLASGGSNKDIARALVLSENTVKSHVRSILEKLDVRNRAEAVAHSAQWASMKEHSKSNKNRRRTQK